MNYMKLGNSDLNVSRICMGCMGFGDAANGQHSWTIDEEHSREIIRRGLELGVNFYDTAIALQTRPARQFAPTTATLSRCRRWVKLRRRQRLPCFHTMCFPCQENG